MLSSVIPARLVFQCGHAALVSLPRVKGETNTQRADRVAREKSAAQVRACDFCAQRLEVVVQAAPASLPASSPTPSLPALPVAVTPPPVAASVEPAAAEPVAPAAAPVAPAVSVPLVVTRRPYHRRNGTPRVKPAAPAIAAAVPVTDAVPVKVAEPVSVSVAPSRTRRKRAPTAKQPAALVAQQPALARYTVQFQVQTVLHAVDVRAALRQVQSLGAIEVLAITSEK